MHALTRRRGSVIIAIAVLLGTIITIVLATAGHHIAPVIELMHYHGRHIAHVIAMHYHGRVPRA